MSNKRTFLPRDISWLSFNARVLQEANDPTVPLRERIRFLGIHSNNQDEFFRVRVATLKRMMDIMRKGTRAAMNLEASPDTILEEIQRIVLQQQNEFSRIWENLRSELANEKIFFLDEKALNKEQRTFVEKYYDEEVSPNIIPLMIEGLPKMPYLRDKSIYLGVVMRKKDTAYKQQYALIEIPAKAVGRFAILPSKPGETNIMLLEDVIRFNLPFIFSFFGYEEYSAHIFKVTKDSELDIDNDIATSLAQKIAKGLRKRREGRPVRFIYDKEMDAGLLEYLIRRLNLSRKDNLIPGGRIHNFRHFMDFPDVFKTKNPRKPSFLHPDLDDGNRITDTILKKDVLLTFPYHSFTPVIDLLRESAMDPNVTEIKMTAYRLAANSKIINALINAVRNGKMVTVMLELRARFDEEANLIWKDLLEQEGVKVLIGVPNMKVHAKVCLIKKKKGKHTVTYGFVSTGNLNEKTARIYSDLCLLTANRKIMADVNRIFSFLERPLMGMEPIRQCKTLWVCPTGMRKNIVACINREIAQAQAGKDAGIIIKVNSLSDPELIGHLQRAVKAGVKLQMIVRGIFCPIFNLPKIKVKPYTISIVDEYLEHARVMVFFNGGKNDMFISSADWMVRNLDHRVEAACPVSDERIKKEILDILQIQLSDNVKARLLESNLANDYAVGNAKKKTKSQVEIYKYLFQKKIESPIHERYQEKQPK